MTYERYFSYFLAPCSLLRQIDCPPTFLQRREVEMSVSIVRNPSTPVPATRNARDRARTQLNLPREIRYQNFDYLRLFLAIEVVAGHLYSGMLLPGYLWVPIPPVAAFVGLSGFLIPQSLERSRGLGHFAWKRVLRTLPALVPLMLAITCVFGFKQTLGAITQYLTAGYYGQFQGVTLPLWSLVVEDTLYACMALLFVFGAHRRIWVTLPILATLIVADTYITDPMTEYRLFHTSIAFFAGNLVYVAYSRLRTVSWPRPVLATAAGLVVAASLVGCMGRLGGLLAQIVSSLGAGSLIANFLGQLGRLDFPLLIAATIVLAMTLPQIKWRIPDLSYGIYIWHVPILLALLYPIGMARNSAWLVAISALTIFAALLSWYFVEKPALRFKNWQPPGRLLDQHMAPVVSEATESERLSAA